jgi:hypothetical protein
MLIHLLPMSVDGAADLISGDVYLNVFGLDIIDSLIHEFSHLLCGNGLHDSRWEDVFFSLGGRRVGVNLDTVGRFCFNIGNITGLQSVLTDYHLLASYRKFSQRVLGTEGHWEVIGEVDGNVDDDQLDSKQQLIRLYPTPKGSFPVVVQYIPVVTHFRSPQARQICYDMMLAEAKIAVGMARRKVAGMPSPDGGGINMDGESLVKEGEEAKKELIETAIKLGEPLQIFTW